MGAQLLTGLAEAQGARYALVCGDPDRVARIAAFLEGATAVRTTR